MFEPINISWKDQQKTIPATMVMGLISVIEDHVTFSELASKNGPKIGKLSGAYAAVLRYAGFNVSAEEVYFSIFEDQSSEKVTMLTMGLLSMMTPPSHLQSKKAAKPGKSKSKSSSQSATS